MLTFSKRYGYASGVPHIDIVENGFIDTNIHVYKTPGAAIFRSIHSASKGMSMDGKIVHLCDVVSKADLQWVSIRARDIFFACINCEKSEICRRMGKGDAFQRICHVPGLQF